MTCPDLCTAEKCAELEARIGALEQALELLEASFEAHTQQQIPEAHEYDSNLRIDGIYQNEILLLSIADVTSQDTAEIPIDLSLLTPESNLRIDGSVANQILYLTVADGESSDIAEIPLPLEHSHDVRVFGSEAFSNGMTGIGIEVYVDDASDFTSFPINLEHTHDVRVFGSETVGCNGQNGIGLAVYVDDAYDETSFPIPTFEPFVTVDVFPVGDRFVIQVSVNGDSDSDSFTIDIPEMNCDELANAIELCCDRLSNQIDDAQNLLTQEIEDVSSKVSDIEQYVTVDISGVLNNGKCVVSTNDDNIPVPLPNVVEYDKENPFTYSSIGLQGIHDNLKFIDNKLDKIFEASCSSVPLLISVNLKDYLDGICKNGIIINEEDYGSKKQYFDAVYSELQDKLKGTVSREILKLVEYDPSKEVTFVVATTPYYALSFLIEICHAKYVPVIEDA